MKYTIDFQKEYKISEQITETIYVVLVTNEEYTNRPFVFTKRVRPSNWRDIQGTVEQWDCGCYHTREFQAEVSIDDVVRAFVNYESICNAYNSYTESVEEVYFDHD